MQQVRRAGPAMAESGIWTCQIGNLFLAFGFWHSGSSLPEGFVNAVLAVINALLSIFGISLNP